METVESTLSEIVTRLREGEVLLTAGEAAALLSLLESWQWERS
jgi:hypothetical protein